MVFIFYLLNHFTEVFKQFFCAALQTHTKAGKLIIGDLPLIFFNFAYHLLVNIAIHYLHFCSQITLRQIFPAPDFINFAPYNIFIAVKCYLFHIIT